MFFFQIKSPFSDVPIICRLLHAQQVLGALAMIDDGELDWKILAISMDDPMASELLGPSKREDFGT